MPKENLNPEGDEILDPLNQEEEESGDDDLELDFEESEDEPLGGEPKDEPVVEVDDALKAYNAEMKKRGLNYNFKSWDDVAKSNKQTAIKFAKKGMAEKETTVEKPVVEKEDNSEISERLLRIEHPESQHVIDDIKKDHPGEDVYKVWSKSEFYKKEAQARAEAEKAKLRVSHPSGGGDGKDETDPIAKKFMKNLPPGFSFKK